MTKIPTIEEMLKAGMHFGHRTSKWHPKMAPFIFGQRNGVHIIDLVKSRKMLESSIEFIKKFASEGKIILFVGTKMQAKKAIKNTAKELDMPYITERWLGGTLTNFLVIKKLIKKYQEMVNDRESGQLKKYTKKEQLEFDRNISKLEMKVGGLTNLTRLPDLILIWDIKSEKTALVEARKKNIPVVATCDTNVDPTNVNYIIPCNDDATKTIKMILKIVKEAVQDGKKLSKKEEN